MIFYLGACFLMGLGIAIDVALASVACARFLETSRQQWQWVTRITATHVTFPMIGYYSAISLQQFDWMRPLIGLVGFVLIAWLLLSIARSFFEKEDSESDRSQRFGWALVLAVSWDALWSGPAKAAQAVGWSSIEVALSFPLAGLVVAVSALLATKFGQELRKTRPLGVQPLENSFYDTFGKLLEIAIFSYFAFLSLLTFTLSWQNPIYWAAAAAVMTALLVSALVWARRNRQR